MTTGLQIKKKNQLNNKSKRLAIFLLTKCHSSSVARKSSKDLDVCFGVTDSDIHREV